MRLVLPVPSRHPSLRPGAWLGGCLLAALAACRGGPGRVDAEWGPTDSVPALRGVAEAGWCAERQLVLVQTTDQDRAVGFTWHFDSLRPDSVAVAAPTADDSLVPYASAALREIRNQEVRGYRSVSGTLRITAVDSGRISARLRAVMQRIGRPDTTTLTAEFRAVPMRRDTTLCTR